MSPFPSGARPDLIGVLGAGRVGSALAGWLAEGGLPVHMADPAPCRRARALATRGVPLHVGALPPWLSDAPLLVLALPDQALQEAAGALGMAGLRPGVIVLHCAGALPADHLRATLPKSARLGAWHPVHPFSEAPPGSPRGVPVALDGDAAALAAGRALCDALHMRPFTVAPEGRVLYHAALALASNGAVGLAASALALLRVAGLPHDEARRLVARLLRRTAANLARRPPHRALTGPVQRGDDDTLARHRAAVAARAPAELPLVEAVVARLKRLMAQEGST